jgi:hypothetical protein
MRTPFHAGLSECGTSNGKIPVSPSGMSTTTTFERSRGHQLPDGHRVVATPILGGLHHEYGLEAARVNGAIRIFTDHRGRGAVVCLLMTQAAGSGGGTAMKG